MFDHVANVFQSVSRVTSTPQPSKRRKRNRACGQGNSEGDPQLTTEDTCYSEISPDDSQEETVQEAVPVGLSNDGTLLERGKCYQFDKFTFAATEIISKNVKGEVIVNGKLDHKIQSSMPVDRLSGQSCRTIASGLPKKDREYLSKMSLESEAEQQKLSNSSESVRHSVRAALLGSAIRREISSALTSKSFRKRVCIGLCSIEHDWRILNINRNTKKVLYSYKGGNIGALDKVLGLKWDILEIDSSHFRFVTQVLFKAKDMMLYMSVFTAICRKGLSGYYREFIQTTELTADQDDLTNSDHEDLEVEIE